MGESSGAHSKESATSFAFGARKRNVTRLSGCTSGETAGPGEDCAKTVEAKANEISRNGRLMALLFYGGKMVTEVRYDLAIGKNLMMTGDERAELDEALLSVWRQALVERKRRVHLGDDPYPVQSTAKRKLAQVDFEFAGPRIRGLEQNPSTSSPRADLSPKRPNATQ